MEETVREWILNLKKSLLQRLLIFASLLVMPAVTGAAFDQRDPATVAGAAFGRSGRVTVTVHLRDSTGLPLAGETVLLERLPDGEYEPAACVTGVDGVCAWQAAPGLYQLFFSHPLDELTQLALAEGGLRGFGITVGDTPVSYHFTFHHDGFVYFDSEPAAPRPAAVIPSLEDLHLGHAPIAATTPAAVEATETPMAPLAETPASATAMQLTGEQPSERPVVAWLLFLSITAGLLITVALPLMLRFSPPSQRARVEPGAGSRRMDGWTAGLPQKASRSPNRKLPPTASAPEPEDGDA